MSKELRIRGISKKTGQKVYMSWAIHKGTIFSSFNKEITHFKRVEDKNFLELQLTAQANLNNVQWELSDAKTMRRFAATARANDFVSCLSATPAKHSTNRA